MESSVLRAGVDGAEALMLIPLWSTLTASLGSAIDSWVRRLTPQPEWKTSVPSLMIRVCCWLSYYFGEAQKKDEGVHVTLLGMYLTSAKAFTFKQWNGQTEYSVICPLLFCSPQNLPEQRCSFLLDLRPSVTVQPLHTLPKYGTVQGGLLENSCSGNTS